MAWHLFAAKPVSNAMVTMIFGAYVCHYAVKVNHLALMTNGLHLQMTFSNIFL